MLNLRQLAKDRWLKQQDIAEILNVAQSKVSVLMNNPKTIKPELLAKLIEYFGEDVIKAYTMPDTAHIPQTQEATVTILTPEVVEDIKAEVRDELRQEGDVIVSVPFVDKVIASAPDLDVRDLVKEKGHTLEEFPLYKMVKGVDYIQTVITMAMAPRFLPGDYLFIRFRNGQALSGKIYLVDTQQYGTMLRYVYIEEGGYTLKALNPEFKDVFVKSEDVYSISSVVLSVNTNTSLTSEVNLAELVKSRDKQMSALAASQQELIQAQTQVLRNQQELIQEIRKQGERLDDERAWSKELTQKALNNK